MDPARSRPLSLDLFVLNCNSVDCKQGRARRNHLSVAVHKVLFECLAMVVLPPCYDDQVHYALFPGLHLRVTHDEHHLDARYSIRAERHGLGASNNPQLVACNPASYPGMVRGHLLGS